MWAVVVAATSTAFGQTTAVVPPKQAVAAQVDDERLQQVQARGAFLFQAMLRKPNDLDAAVEYAALSAQVGDLEAAISTLRLRRCVTYTRR